MNGKGHGQLRRSQVITTFGPGALIDLPNDSAIVGGLDTWGSVTNSGKYRRAAPLGQADVHDRRSQPASLRPTAGAGELAGSTARNRRVAIPRVVRGAGVRCRPRRRHSFEHALAAHGSAHRPHQRALRQEAGCCHAVRPRLLEGPRRRHRLVPVRPRAGRSLSPAAMARRAWYERRPGRADRALRVRQVAAHARGGRLRELSAGSVPGRETLAGAPCERGVPRAQPAVDPHRLERLVPAGGQCAVPARSR